MPEKPLAAVVQLKRRSQVPTGPFDVARQRHRLVAEMGELTRVVAVALLAAAADRLIGVIVKPAITAANGERCWTSYPGPTPRTSLHRSSPGRRAPLQRRRPGEVELTKGVNAS